MIKINTIKSKEGLYIADSGTSYSGRGSLNMSHVYNGDILPEDTHKPTWKFLRGVTELTSIMKQDYQRYSATYWELKDIEDGVKFSIPWKLTKEDVTSYADDDDCTCYNFGEYSKFSQFYTSKRDKLPLEMINVEFEVVPLGEVDVEEVSNFSDMKVSLCEGNYNSPVANTNLSSIASYGELAEMLVPELAIHNRPCSVNADTTYKIIRAWVKDNLVSEYAKITSDYDFCFTVQKRIKLAQDVHWTSEQTKNNGRSYAKRRVTHHTKTHKEVQIFEMCPSKVYSGYTPIKGFTGTSLEDLSENIKGFLEELMLHINAPLQECECCNGLGKIMTDFDKTKR